MDPEALARRSLQADGAFCVVAGAAVTAAREPVAAGLRLPVPVVTSAGVLTSGWGAVLATASGNQEWRTTTAAVAVANAAAADGLALVGMTRADGGTRAGTLLLAGAVGGFALVQGYAWLRGRGAAPAVDVEPA